jgi:hypothetical protein
MYDLTRLTDYERRYVRMLDELQNAPAVQVRHEERGPVEEFVGDADETFQLIAEECGVELDPRLQRSFLRFEAVSSHWAMEQGDLYLTGEFSVRHLGAAMLGGVEDLDLEVFDPESGPESSEELRPFDEHRKGGGGSFTSLRIRPGVTSPEVWFFDGTSRLHKLDLDYGDYLDALLVTKGTYGWQYLFTDVDAQDMNFQFAAENMRDMLRVFPEIFPDHDYAPFRARLEDQRRQFLNH